MNNSFRRTDESIKEVLTKAKNKETAFDGTVKEGFERRFTVINERDLKKYVPEIDVDDFVYEFNIVSKHIEEGRIADGKKPFNNYLVINLDEPYADEVIEIMKRHGHWG